MVYIFVAATATNNNKIKLKINLILIVMRETFYLHLYFLSLYRCRDVVNYLSFSEICILYRTQSVRNRSVFCRLNGCFCINDKCIYWQRVFIYLSKICFCSDTLFCTAIGITIVFTGSFYHTIYRWEYIEREVSI